MRKCTQYVTEGALGFFVCFLISFAVHCEYFCGVAVVLVCG